MAKTEKKKDKERKTIVPWRSFSELAPWERDIERMFSDFFDRRWSPLRGGRWWPTKTADITAPAIDIYEEKDEIVAKAELPGVEKDDIHVDVSDNILTIKGEKKKEEEIKEEDYYRSERSYGAFVRTVALPKDVQVDKARASFKNGLLEVRIPKTEEAKKKEFKVKVD